MATKKVTNSSGTRKSASRAKKAQAQEEIVSQAALAPASESPWPSVEEIQARAYEIFRSGDNPRDPVADWCQAERELRAKLSA